MAYVLNDPLEPIVWTAISTVSGAVQNVSPYNVDANSLAPLTFVPA